jgi:amino acid transporter
VVGVRGRADLCRRVACRLGDQAQRDRRQAAGELDHATARWGRLADGVIVVAYVISVALYLRIMAEYLVGFFTAAGSALWEPIIACVAVVVIVAVGALRGFAGLDRLDRVSLGAVLVLTTVLGVVLLVHDGRAVVTGSLTLPPVPPVASLSTLLILGGLVITVQGFETVRYLGAEYDAPTRVWASRLAQLVSSTIYVGFVAVATPVMGLGTSAGPDNTLLDITGRLAPWLALPLVLSAVLSQFSAAIADTSAADGNLLGLSRWFRGRRAYLISGAAAILLAALVPTLTIVTIASRAFAAYYAIQAVIAVRTSEGWARKLGFGALAGVMLAVTLFAEPAK